MAPNSGNMQLRGIRQLERGFGRRPADEASGCITHAGQDMRMRVVQQLKPPRGYPQLESWALSAASPLESELKETKSVEIMF